MEPLITHMQNLQGKAQTWLVREDFSKNSKKSDIIIITIRSGTHLPYLKSDIKISAICSKTLYLPTPKK